jgi:hypothetical protein
MSFKIIEEKEYGPAAIAWDKITHSLEPEIDTLEDNSDRRYFASKIKFLIGKDIRLSNIQNSAQLYFFMFYAEFIIYLTRYPMLIDEEYIRSQIALFLNAHGELISLDGLGWKYGPMGFQQQSVKQEVISSSPGGK